VATRVSRNQSKTLTARARRRSSSSFFSPRRHGSRGATIAGGRHPWCRSSGFPDADLALDVLLQRAALPRGGALQPLQTNRSQ